MSGRALRRHLDALLHGRSVTTRWRPSDDEAAQLRTAIELRAAQPDDSAPSPEFVEALQQRLASKIGDADAGPTPGSAEPASSRRRVLIGTSIAAAAAAAAAGGGAVADHALTARREDAVHQADSTVVTPTNGTWHKVAVAADLPEGATRAFDIGVTTGFLHRENGAVVAVSGVCTHQGCRLALVVGRLDCPCHVTSFAPTGRVLTHQLPIAPAALPRWPVRESAGAIEIFAPHE